MAQCEEKKEIFREQYDFKRGGWGDSNGSSKRHDFVVENELTVRITLNEYRYLLKAENIIAEKLKIVEEESRNAKAELKKAKEELEKIKHFMRGDDEMSEDDDE